MLCLQECPTGRDAHSDSTQTGGRYLHTWSEDSSQAAADGSWENHEPQEIDSVSFTLFPPPPDPLTWPLEQCVFMYVCKYGLYVLYNYST